MQFSYLFRYSTIEYGRSYIRILMLIVVTMETCFYFDGCLCWLLQHHSDNNYYHHYPFDENAKMMKKRLYQRWYDLTALLWFRYCNDEINKCKKWWTTILVAWTMKLTYWTILRGDEFWFRLNGGEWLGFVSCFRLDQTKDEALCEFRRKRVFFCFGEQKPRRISEWTRLRLAMTALSNRLACLTTG